MGEKKLGEVNISRCSFWLSRSSGVLMSCVGEKASATSFCLRRRRSQRCSVALEMRGVGGSDTRGLARCLRCNGRSTRQTFSRSTPNTLENSSCLVDSGFPITNTRNLGHGARYCEDGVNLTMGLLLVSSSILSVCSIGVVAVGRYDSLRGSVVLGYSIVHKRKGSCPIFISFDRMQHFQKLTFVCAT